MSTDEKRCIDEAMEKLRAGIERSDEPKGGIMREALALLESCKAEQPPVGELKYCKEHRTIHCSCQQRIIGIQQQEIERLKQENADLKRPLEVNGFKAEGMMAVGKELTRLTPENAALKRELLEHGDHTASCRHRTLEAMRSEEESGCTCGWEARREQIEAEIKKGGE